MLAWSRVTARECFALKIAQVSLYYHPVMLGGAEWYVYNISREMAKRGHSVDVITAGSYNGTTLPREETKEGVKVRRVPLRYDISYRLKVWEGLTERIREGDYDIIHTYDYAQPHSKVALRAGKLMGVPVVLTVFDVHSMIPRVWYKRLPMRLIDGYYSTRVLREADKILVRSPTLVDPLLEKGAPLDRVVVTPSGVRDESLADFDGTEFLARNKIDAWPVLLFMGRLNPMKGPQLLVEATASLVREFPNITVVFMGNDQSGYSNYLRERARSLGVEGHIHILSPNYDFQEKMQAYSSCDAFVLPTGFEGTSQAIFEAMAQGKPVISTAVGGVPYQIRDGVDGLLVQFGNVDALVKKIRSVLTDAELARKLGSNAKARASKFRYSKLVDDLMSIYEDTLNGRKKPGSNLYHGANGTTDNSSTHLQS